MQRIFSQRVRRMALAAAVFASVVASFAPASWAGDKWRRNVTVIIGASPRAYGDTDTARHSAGRERIGCLLSNWWGSETGLCYASDKDGVFLSCSTEEPSFRDTIRAMPEHARFDFTVAADGRCSVIRIDSGSEYLP